MYKYLIIDDETLIRKGTIKKLEALSCKIQCCGEASNGKEGIQMAEALSPDIIILDMQMPVMDGMELLPYLSSHFPDIMLIVISGFQNFDYMKQAIASKAIDYILKPFSKEEIQKTVLSSIDALEHQKEQSIQINTIEEDRERAYYSLDIKLLYNLLMGYDTSSTKINSHKLRFINQMHSFALITLYANENLGTLHLNEWLADQRFSDLVLYLPHASNPQIGFIILFLPEHSANMNQANPFLLEFLNAFSLLSNQYSLHLGVSSIHNDITNLNLAYIEAKKALDAQKISVPDFSHFYTSDIPAPIDIIWDMEDTFLFRIESGNSPVVKELAEQLFSYYLQIPECTLADVKCHCEQIGTRCRFILNYYLNQNENTNNTSSNMQAIVNTLFSLDELKNYYMQFFLNITNLLRDQSFYNNAELIEQIKLYIDRNYQQNLTREFISSLFYLNQSYLSQLFKKKTGVKFVDYLNDVRIEKAKDLLLHTDRKMYQIAKAVGYENPKYFFRLFKKKTGYSPEEYRLMSSNGEDHRKKPQKKLSLLLRQK